MSQLLVYGNISDEILDNFEGSEQNIKSFGTLVNILWELGTFEVSKLFIFNDINELHL